MNKILSRLQNKTSENFLLNKLMKELGINMATAKAAIEIFLDFINISFGRGRSPHQIVRTLVSVNEPPGKPIKYCSMVDVNITVDHPHDVEILYQEGAVKARMVKCFRFAWEAYEQGGAITVEDISSLLTVNTSTVKDMIKKLESLGLFVPTRGRLKDIGRVPSHKEIIGTLLAQGHTYTQISAMTGHSENSIER